jgi:uncharacterized membrane protein YoaT (DUF817 family)
MGGVPLFSGFMYSCIGSYIARTGGCAIFPLPIYQADVLVIGGSLATLAARGSCRRASR